MFFVLIFDFVFSKYYVYSTKYTGGVITSFNETTFSYDWTTLRCFGSDNVSLTVETGYPQYTIQETTAIIMFKFDIFALLLCFGFNSPFQLVKYDEKVLSITTLGQSGYIF